jgi:hypothetical protein
MSCRLSAGKLLLPVGLAAEATKAWLLLLHGWLNPMVKTIGKSIRLLSRFWPYRTVLAATAWAYSIISPRSCNAGLERGVANGNLFTLFFIGELGQPFRFLYRLHLFPVECGS